MQKRTLLTGAAGFTGPYLAALLAAQGHDVHGLVNMHDGRPIPGVRKIYDADLADSEAMRAIVTEVRPDHVVHLAGISFVAHTDIEQLYRSNILGTRQLLEALAGLPSPPRSILMSSSANVYGNAREGMLDEDLDPEPANDYGVTKVAMEYVARIYANSLPIIIARPFNYTGRGQSADFVIPKIVEHALKRAPSIEMGNLDVRRDFSDVRSVVDAYARLLAAPDAIGRAFNVCSGRPYSLREVIDLVQKLSGHTMAVSVNPAFCRTNEVLTLFGSNARLIDCIGPFEVPPLAETLRWMLSA